MKYYFPGHYYHFTGQSIHDLKAINQDMCEKAYHFIQCMIDYRHFYDTASSSTLLIDPLLFKFKPTWDIKTNYRYCFSSTTEVFFYRHIHYLFTGLFCSKWIFFHRQYFFQDLEMNMLFSRSYVKPDRLNCRIIITVISNKDK